MKRSHYISQRSCLANSSDMLQVSLMIMVSSSSSIESDFLELRRPSPQNSGIFSLTMSIRSLLDEGDGKKDDINYWCRNEVWKTF